jgi:hypothetical protein
MKSMTPHGITGLERVKIKNQENVTFSFKSTFMLEGLCFRKTAIINCSYIVLLSLMKVILQNVTSDTQTESNIAECHF